MRVPIWILFVSLVYAIPRAEKAPSYFALEDNDQIIVGEWGRKHKNVEPRSGSGDSQTGGSTGGTSTAASTTTTTDGTTNDSDDSTADSFSTQLGVPVILSLLLCINSM